MRVAVKSLINIVLMDPLFMKQNIRSLCYFNMCVVCMYLCCRDFIVISTFKLFSKEISF